MKKEMVLQTGNKLNTDREQIKLRHHFSLAQGHRVMPSRKKLLLYSQKLRKDDNFYTAKLISFTLYLHFDVDVYAEFSQQTCAMNKTPAFLRRLTKKPPISYCIHTLNRNPCD